MTGDKAHGSEEHWNVQPVLRPRRGRESARNLNAKAQGRKAAKRIFSEKPGNRGISHTERWSRMSAVRKRWGPALAPQWPRGNSLSGNTLIGRSTEFSRDAPFGRPSRSEYRSPNKSHLLHRDAVRAGGDVRIHGKTEFENRLEIWSGEG